MREEHHDYVLIDGVKWFKDTIHRYSYDLMLYCPKTDNEGWYIRIEEMRLSWGTYSEAFTTQEMERSHQNNYLMDGVMSHALFKEATSEESMNPQQKIEIAAALALKIVISNKVNVTGRKLRPVMTPEMEAEAKALEAALKEVASKVLYDKMSEQLPLKENISVKVKSKTDNTIDKILGRGNFVPNMMTKTSQGFAGVKVRSEIPNRYRYFFGEFITQSEKAVLFRLNGLSKWIPKSQICILAGTEFSDSPKFYATSWILSKIGF